MSLGLVALGILAAIAVLVLALLLRDAYHKIAVARLESQQLRALVKKKVERPNVFSHEVRTPLTLIKGAAELLAEETPGPLNDRQREFVHTITVNAQQVIGLAEDLLTEAKIEAQLFELRLERFDLRTLVRASVRDARRIHHTRITLDDHWGPIICTGDKQLLRQALWNLVNNACRHSGDSAMVSVSVSCAEGQCIIAVSDTGAGMTPAERATLFEPFVVGSSQRPGTGLGMMITQRIVAQHQGRLLVDSVEGRGTTIFFTIPVEKEEGEHG